MGIGLLIDYLNNSNALLRAQSLLKELCGLELILLSLEGKIIPLNSSKAQNEFELSTQKPVWKTTLKTKNDLLIPQNYLDQVVEAKESIDFVTKEGLIRLVVPIIYNNQVVGFVATGDSGQFRLNRGQVNSIKSFLNETIRQVVQHDFKFFNDFKASEVSHQRKTLYRITQYINDNYQQSDLTLDDVSKKNNISYFYLSHLFKKELKTSFSNYLNNLRIDVASRLLKDQSLTVSQVSYSCGFEDPSYFSKVFKKLSGFSPASYRQKASSKKSKKS